MPRIPQFVATQTPSGTVQSGGPVRGLDLSSVVNAAYQITATQEALARKQDEESKRLQHNEAVSYTANTLSQADIDFREREEQLASEGHVELTASLLKEFDSYAKTKAEQAPQSARPVLNRKFAQMRSGLHARVFNRETKIRQDSVLRADDVGLDADAAAVFVNPEAFQDKAALRLAANGALQIPENVKAERAQKIRQKLAASAADGLIDRDPGAFLERVGVAGAKTGKDGKPLPSNPQEAEARVARDPILSSLSSEELRRSVDRATLLKVQRDQAIQAERDRKAREAEAYAMRREREANQAYTILSDWARDGIAADPASAKPLLDKIAGTPYQSAYQAQAQKVASRAAAAALPIGAQRAELNRLYAQRAESGTSETLQHEISEREQILATVQRDYQEDALMGGAKRGLVSVTPIDMSMPLQDIVQAAGARAPQVQTMSAITGGAVSPFTASEAIDLKRTLDSLPERERSTAIANLSQAVGQRAAQGLANQLDKQDRPLALAFAAAGSMTTAGRYTSELILRGQTAKRDGTSTKNAKQPELKANQWKTQAALLLDGAYDDPRANAQFRDAAELIMHGIAAEKGGSLSSDDMERAVSLAIGGSLIEHNGKKTPIPAGLDEDGFRSKLQAITPDQIKAPGGQVVAAGVPIPVDQFAQSLPGQQLMPVGRGRYAVLVKGRPVMNTAGDPVVIEVR